MLPFDPESLKAMYPETPPWGYYLALQIHDLTQAVEGKADWNARDISIVGGIVTAVVLPIIAALKGTGAV